MLSPNDKNGVTDPVFSIICASHRPDVLARFLQPSVRSQRLPCELRVVDTAREGFASCAAALNAGAAGTRGRYLMFVHHDVAWESADFLQRAAEFLDRLPRLGAAGIVGMSDKGGTWQRRGRNAVLPGEFPGKLDGWAPIESPETAQTVDDQMLIIPAGVFRRLRFDDSTCDGWHLYGADYCLSVARLGLQVYVLPLLVHHLSPGKVDAAYFRTLRKVIVKHRRHYRWIYTTCAPWTTRLPVLLQEMYMHAQAPVRRVSRWTLIRLGLWGLIRRNARHGAIPRVP